MNTVWFGLALANVATCAWQVDEYIRRRGVFPLFLGAWAGTAVWVCLSQAGAL